MRGGIRKGERRISLPIFSFRLKVCIQRIQCSRKPVMQTSSYAALIELTGLADQNDKLFDIPNLLLLFIVT